MSNLSDTQFLENVQQGHMRYDPKKAVRFSNEVFYQLMTIRPSSDDPLYPRLTVRRGVGREFTRKSFRTEKKNKQKNKKPRQSHGGEKLGNHYYETERIRSPGDRINNKKDIVLINGSE